MRAGLGLFSADRSNRPTGSMASPARSYEPVAHPRILIADDHALFRRGLRLMLSTIYPHAEVAEAASVDEALRAIDGAPGFDLVLCDLAMPGMNGVEGLAALCARLPDAPVVMLSAYEDQNDIVSALEAGARGYILKSSSEETLRNALALVLAGETYLPANVFFDRARRWTGDRRSDAPAVPPDSPLAVLTSRQRDVLLHLIDGKSNKEIARDLGLLESTVKAHVKAILEKLGVDNRTKAAMIAAELGWRPPGHGRRP
jgi:DNA-binding NarL/FixJ family response regulator